MIRMTLISACVAMLLAGPAPGAAQADSLRSPWDIQPPVPSAAAASCPETPVLPRDIVSDDYYTDAKHSVIDPARLAAYQASQASFQKVMTNAAASADRFTANGSAEAARCVMRILRAQAGAEAMTGRMSSNQASYVQNWTLGALAIAYLKARPAVASPEDAAAITAWMMRVARDVQAYMDKRRANPKITDARNNHYYWAGLAVMAAGVAGDNRAMFDWGVGTCHDGIGRIDADGTLPLEMDRGARALHYHLFAAAPLVLMAEFGAANGLDLYAAEGGALHRLVARSLDGLRDNSFFARQAGIAQDTPDGGRISSSDLIWARPYARRFPSPAYDALAARTRLAPMLYLGGMPPA